jgi:hypothetical protein
MLGVFVDMSYTTGPPNLALLPIRASFSGVQERLAKASHSHRAIDPDLTVATNKLQRNHNMDVRSRLALAKIGDRFCWMY